MRLLVNTLVSIREHSNPRPAAVGPGSDELTELATVAAERGVKSPLLLHSREPLPPAPEQRGHPDPRIREQQPQHEGPEDRLGRVAQALRRRPLHEPRVALERAVEARPPRPAVRVARVARARAPRLDEVPAGIFRGGVAAAPRPRAGSFAARGDAAAAWIGPRARTSRRDPRPEDFGAATGTAASSARS